MYKLYRGDFLDIRDVISNNLVELNLASSIESSSISSFKFGNLINNGILINLEKGNYFIDNVFYSKVYPGSTIYDRANGVSFNRKLSYFFSPYRYYNTGYVIGSNRTTTAGLPLRSMAVNGFSYTYNDELYLISGARFLVDNNTEFSSDDFYICNSSGSFNLDASLSSYKTIDRDITGYLNGSQPLIQSGNIKTYITYTDSESHRAIGSLYGVNNTIDRPYSGYYFRDFLNSAFNSSVGWYNGIACDYFLLDTSVVGSTAQLANARSDYRYFPTLDNFYGFSSYDTTLPYLLYGNDSTLTLSRSFYSDFNFNYKLNGNSYYVLPEVSPYSLNPTVLFESNGYVDSEFMYNMGAGSDTIVSSSIDDELLNTNEIIPEVVNLNINNVFGSSDNSIYKMNTQLSTNGYSTRFNYADYKDLVFYNEIYFNDTTTYNIRLSALNISDLDVVGVGVSTNAVVQVAFDSAMAFGFGAITLGGIATACFLFRALFSLLRGSK